MVRRSLGGVYYTKNGVGAAQRGASGRSRRG